MSVIWRRLAVVTLLLLTPSGALASPCGTAWHCDEEESFWLELRAGPALDIGTALGNGYGGNVAVGFRFYSDNNSIGLGSDLGLDIQYTLTGWDETFDGPVHLLSFVPAFRYTWPGSRWRFPAVLHFVLPEIGMKPSLSGYAFVRARVFRLPVAFLLHPNVAIEVEPALGVILASQSGAFVYSFSPRVSLIARF